MNTFSVRGSWLFAFGLGLAVTLGPVALRNYFVGGQFHLTTSQLGPNFYIGNNPNANGTYQPLLPGRGDAKFEQTDAVSLAERATGRKLSPKEVSEYYLSQSFEFISQQPLAWLKLMAVKFGLTFNRREVIDTEDQYTVAEISPILRFTDFIFNFGFLVPLSALGITITCPRWKRLWVIYLVMLAFAVTVIVFFVFGRYRFPIAPPLMLFVGPAILFLFDLIRSGDTRRIALVAVLFGAIYAGCNLRLVSPRIGRGITLSNYGVQALIRSDYVNAERFLVASANQLPDSALIHNNIGVLYRETERPKLALQHFRKAIELEPDDDKIRDNLRKLLQQIPFIFAGLEMDQSTLIRPITT